MIEKLFKSLAIKIFLGAVVFVLVVFGFFLLTGKPPQSSIMETGKPISMKIPKPDPTIERSEKKLESEMVPETTPEEKIPERNETVWSSESSFESEEAETISVEDILEEEANAETSFPEDTRKEEEIETSISSQVTDPFSGMETGEAVLAEEPVADAGWKTSEDPKAEEPVVQEQPETETVVTENKLSFSEQQKDQLLLDIVLSESGSEQKLIFQTDSPVRTYKYFILSNPPRFVVDFPGVWQQPDFFEKTADSSLVSRIRLWNHGDKLRIVTDLKSDKTLFPVFTKSSDGVEVVLKTR
ncbi:MAG: AMIN domain-containing protein [Desulfobacterales bacterium]